MDGKPHTACSHGTHGKTEQRMSRDQRLPLCGGSSEAAQSWCSRVCPKHWDVGEVAGVAL